MSKNVIGTGLGGREPPQGVDPLTPGSEKKSEVKSKSSIKSAENRAASSLRVGGYRYTSILCVPKLVWVSSVLKLQNLVVKK